MGVLSIELPENVLDALADRVAARVLERLERGQGGERWLDAKQAADYLGLSINALHKLTAARQLPAEQEAPGHKLWFRRSQLDDWRSGGRNGALASRTPSER
jgi:Helix-turn-helix domain